MRAFDVNAIDYLLKPVQWDRLEEALRRVENYLDQRSEKSWGAKLERLLSEVQPKQYLTRIEIRSQGRSSFVNVEDISWLKADRNYIEVYANQHTHIARIPLVELERQLDPNHFKRVSRSAIVNLNCISSIESLGRSGYEIILTSGEKVSLTYSIEELRQRLRYGV